MSTYICIYRRTHIPNTYIIDYDEVWCETMENCVSDVDHQHYVKRCERYAQEDA